MTQTPPMDWSLRHRILGIPDPPLRDAPHDYIQGDDGHLHWVGGSEGFAGLSVGAMQTLIELGFLDADGYQNASPTAGVFLQFMKRYPHFTAIGYAIHPDRADARISIEGIESRGVPLGTEALAAFEELAKTADECDIVLPDYARCWWD